MKRRAAVVGGVAVAAGAAGWGVARWRGQPAGVTGRAGDASETAGTAGIWSLQFERPAGGALPMAALRGRPLLLNFWATWCPPCVRELPLLDQFGHEHASAGWQVVGLAVDSPSAVNQFLATNPVRFAIGIAGAEGLELSRQLGNDKGALPFSVVFDRAGAPVHRKSGTVEPADLQNWRRLVA